MEASVRRSGHLSFNLALDGILEPLWGVNPSHESVSCSLNCVLGEGTLSTSPSRAVTEQVLRPIMIFHNLANDSLGEALYLGTHGRQLSYVHLAAIPLVAVLASFSRWFARLLELHVLDLPVLLPDGSVVERIDPEVALVESEVTECVLGHRWVESGSSARSEHRLGHHLVEFRGGSRVLAIAHR